jgi:type II secretory pathway pseudopilin PulG
MSGRAGIEIAHHRRKLWLCPLQAGITLIELLIALLMCGIVFFGLMRVFSTGLKGYSLQQNIVELDQTVQATLERLSEVIMQAGAELPDSGYNVITISSPSDIAIRVNPKGSINLFTMAVASSHNIPVEKAAPFAAADSIIKQFASGAAPIALQLDRAYTSGNFVNGIDAISTPNQIRLAVAASFAPGDMIFSCRTDRYFLNNRQIIVASAGVNSVLADNIDSLSILFYKAAITPTATTQWSEMITAHIGLRVRTSSPDRKYDHPAFHDGYRRASREIDFRLRNRF